MTAPDLVELAAAAMWDRRYPDDPWGGIDSDDCDREEYLDDARAVLDALAEAGNVEWGALHRKRKVPYRYAKEQDARNSAKANHGVLVSRLAFPWTAVE